MYTYVYVYSICIHYVALYSILCRREKYFGLVWTEVVQNRRHISTRIQSSLLVVDLVSVRISVHTTQESVTKTYLTCDDSLSRPKQRSIAPAQKSIRSWRFCCVYESPIRYVFGAGTRAIRFSVDIAIVWKRTIHADDCGVNLCEYPYLLHVVVGHKWAPLIG